MLGMEQAVARVQKAIAGNEKILIYGDYDVDGTTGTAVRLPLKLLGVDAGFHVPHRFTEGYGIQQPALEKAVADGYTLAISVDCGIRAHEPLHWARDHGLDVIVTDHHLPDEGEGVPPLAPSSIPTSSAVSIPTKTSLAWASLSNLCTHSIVSAIVSPWCRRF